MHSSASVPTASAKGWPLHVKVMIGFILGTLAGLAVHALAADATWVQGVIEYATRPFGQVFLNLLFMLVVPLMFSALVLGVAELGDIASLGRLGWKTLIYTATVTAVAVGIGLVCVNLFQPGAHMDPALVGQVISGVEVGPVSEMEAVIADRNIQIGVITVPATEAQAIADRMVAAGVHGIWNFAPVRIKVPDSVQLVSEDLSVGLTTLSYHLRRQTP